MATFSKVKKKYEAVFESVKDGIIIIDSQGIIENLNPAACQLFGYESNELVGRNVKILMPKEYSVLHDGFIEHYLKTGVPKIIGIGREVPGMKKDKTTFPFLLTVTEVNLEDRTIFIGIIHDLTEIKRSQEQLKELNKELEKKVLDRTYALEGAINKLLEVNKKLEEEIANKIEIQKQLKERESILRVSLAHERELSELKSRFVSMASHEFRTPLATILSSAGLISRYTQEEQQVNIDKHINKIKTSVTHLTGILNDFLSVNRLEEGKIQAKIQEFNISDLLTDVEGEMRLILKKGQVLKWETNIQNTMVISDWKIIKNIIINLVSNSIKYSNEDGVINCKIENNHEFLTIRIEDNGIGIPEEDQKRLFKRFFRASNVANIEGTGLGLNIVHKYVEMLNGSLDFSSKLYDGTTFTIKIPNNNKIEQP